MLEARQAAPLGTGSALCACVCVFCVRACASALCWPSRGTAGTGGIDSSACAARAATFAFAFVPSVGSPALAAGVTWTSRTTSAPWAARWGHTSVIDAAGAIYVLGGFNGESGGVYTVYEGSYNDVWISADGGADRTRAGVLKR
jgi:hypothetical protein